MQAFIAKVGKGPRASKDLTWDEAKQAMRLLIEGKASPAQVGAFVLAMRMKLESVSELAAFTSAAREYVAPIRITTKRPLVDVGTYAGKQDTFHALIGGAIIAAAAGAAVLLHGIDGTPGRVTTGAVLAALGIPHDRVPDRVAADVQTQDFGYLDLALYHPPLAKFLQLRDELGVRTLFHPVAKMLNPAHAPAQVIGITHPPYFEKTAEALRMLGSRRALVVRGVEGEPELSIAAATRVLDLTGEQVLPLTLNPTDIGLPRGSFRDMAGFPPAQVSQEAVLVRRIMRNEVRGAQRDWIVQNGALLLYAAGVSSSISGAVRIAQQAVESGGAAQKLADLTVSTGKKESAA